MESDLIDHRVVGPDDETPISASKKATSRGAARVGGRENCPEPPDLSSLDDAQVLLIARSGSVEAAAAILDKHAALVSTILRKIHRVPEADLEDLRQDVYGRFLRYLPRITYAKGFLVSTAIGVAINYHRGRRRRARNVLDFSRHVQRDTALPFCFAEGQASQRLDVEAALSAVGPRCADVLRAIVVDRVSYEEYARRSGVPVGSVGPTICRCLQKIRRHLRSRGYGSRVATSSRP